MTRSPVSWVSNLCLYLNTDPNLSPSRHFHLLFSMFTYICLNHPKLMPISLPCRFIATVWVFPATKG